MMKWVVIWGAVAVISAIASGLLAAAKHRDYSFWAAWSFVFPPMLLILLVFPKNQGPKPKRRTLDEEDATEAS